MDGGTLKSNIQLVPDLNGRSKEIRCCEKCPLDQLGDQCSMQAVPAPLRLEEFSLGFHYLD